MHNGRVVVQKNSVIINPLNQHLEVEADDFHQCVVGEGVKEGAMQSLVESEETLVG